MSIFWSPGMTIAEIEKQIIRKALNHYPTKASTAQALGICLRTLDYRCEAYAKEDEEQRLIEEQRLVKRQEFIDRSRGLHIAKDLEPVAQIVQIPIEVKSQVTKLRSK